MKTGQFRTPLLQSPRKEQKNLYLKIHLYLFYIIGVFRITADPANKNISPVARGTIFNLIQRMYSDDLSNTEIWYFSAF